MQLAVKKMKNISLVTLIISNLIPLFGLAVFNWDVRSVISIYWVENVVVGFYNVLKMIKTDNQKSYFETSFNI